MDKLEISLGEFSLMESGQPLPFDRFLILQLILSQSQNKVKSCSYTNVYIYTGMELVTTSRKLVRFMELLQSIYPWVEVQPQGRRGGVILAMTMSRSTPSIPPETKMQRLM